MILLIDNYDSFTYNLYQYIGELYHDIQVVRNDEITIEQIEEMHPQALILSPGPGYPKDAGITMETIRHFNGKIPMLGVCLGHQSICEAFGGTIVRAAHLMHGKASQMVLDTTSPIFAGLPKMVSCGRYHSLIAQESDFPECLKVTARDENGQIMALQHRETQTYGVQFHPESLLTGDGKRMLANFLNLIPGVSVELPPIVEDRPKTELKKYIAKVADGSMRDALSLLDQCIAFYLGEKLTYDKAIEVLGAVDTSVYSRMFKNMADLDVIGCMKLLDEIMMSGRDLNQFITGLIWYLRNLMVISVSASGSEMVDVSTEQLEQMQQEIKKVDETGIIRYIRILSELSNQIKYATQKRVLTEVAFVKLCVPEMEKKTSDDSLLARIDAIERKLESGIFVNGQPDNGGQNVSFVTNEAKTSKESQPEVVLPKMVSDDLKKINGKWQQILSDISVSSRSFLMPEICKKTVSQDGETLILQFTDATAEAYFNRDDKRNLDELKTVISNIVGVDAGIIAETVSNEQSRNSLDLSQIIDKINFDVQIKK